MWTGPCLRHAAHARVLLQKLLELALYLSCWCPLRRLEPTKLAGGLAGTAAGF